MISASPAATAYFTARQAFGRPAATSTSTQAAAAPLQTASKVSFSVDGLRQAAAAAQQPAQAAGRYRLDSAAGASLIKTGLVAAYKMPDALVKEMALRTEEEKIREDIHLRYAHEHQYQTVGQVMLNGKFAAEVDESGGFGLVQSLPGLSDKTLSPGERLKEIARALESRGTVEIKYDKFVPGLGGWGGPSAPESMLPPFTARSHQEIFQAAQQAMAQPGA